MKRQSKQAAVAIFVAGLFVAGAVGIVAAIAVVPQVTGKGSAPQRAARRSAAEPAERETVRRHLRDNTPTGEWEEIEWYPVIPIDSVSAIRLKYRTQNPFGGQSVVDEVFVLNRDGSIQYTEANGDRRIWWRK